MQLVEENMVVLLKQGNRLAFEYCYKKYSATVYTAILRICKDSHVANDLLQDTFVDAFENIRQFTHHSSFIAWLKRIAFNNTLNYIRKQKNTMQVIDKLTHIDVEKINMAESHEQSQLLEKLMSQLTTKESLVMWLFIVEQYSHEEIAILTEKSPSYSKSIVSRSLKKLREHKEVKAYASLY